MKQTIQKDQAVRPKVKCLSVHVAWRGRLANVVFCQHDRGHDGEHRGFRKRWTDVVKP